MPVGDYRINEIPLIDSLIPTYKMIGDMLMNFANSLLSGNCYLET